MPFYLVNSECLLFSLLFLTNYSSFIHEFYAQFVTPESGIQELFASHLFLANYLTVC